MMVCVCIGSTLCSCGDHEIDRLGAERRNREAMAELRKSHREEMKQLADRIGALEQNNSSLLVQLEQARTAGSIALPVAAAEIPASVAVEDDGSPEARKIATYQQTGLSGVPAPVAAEILRKARRDPRSWAALEDIEAEGAGYRTVQAFAASQTKMLREDRDQLVAAAKREHPGDWSEMARFIDRQVDAWTILEEWKVKGVPGLETWESEAVLCGALESFPYNWACALDAVAQASRGEIAGRDRPRVSRRH
jgi:transcriptional regulator with XRE-family HTH domain